jgi:uncharacterized peroxidase-related enzyme
MGRLRILDEFSGMDRLKATTAETALGFLPGVLGFLLHRPAFFGRPWKACYGRWLRAGDGWTKGDAELFAALVSDRNNCAFCLQAHGAVAARSLGRETVDRVVADWRTAPVSGRVRAALGFLDALTLRPAEVGVDDARALMAAGIDRAAAEHVVAIGFLFAVQNRLLDAFGYDLPPDKVGRLAWLLDLQGRRALR